ncbi:MULTISPECIES: TRAP transporter substrate-binding protein [unclassified Hahella]|uniref:TRAP transporter substrate-binding protein n=1 Tax=unclassified Hahella TaxID=2624107 RepID=UPI001C1EAC36|nr:MULTISPECIES: TRAP transporter substrate-binding protein [unclassified Hahella]MBU6954708.1 TRAP transporter substrate-binding protein [Hahella sp. HN01]MDG9668897.1 TRAP transporter substrate-binding protein [Hahella sp. CR1]
MKRRYLFSLMGAGMLGMLLGGCSAEKEAAAPVAQQAPKQTIQWKLVTSWPKNFPGLGEAPERFAKEVERMSDGRLKVKVYGAGELVPALEVFDAVSQGTAEAGHAASYYWKGKIPAAQFFSTVPFGLNAQEINSWISYGGGLELWRELYEPFGVIPMLGGNTGVQMGGWFNKEINSLDDLKGLKMRIPGLGGEVLQRAGGTPVQLPGGEIFTALQTGAIDATEWVGPYNDLAFGLHKAAKYYYYPGWHEPGTSLEFTFNKKAFEALPKDLQAIVEVAARMINQDMLDEYTARNNAALNELVNNHGVDVRRFPDDVLKELQDISRQTIQEIAEKDPAVKKVYESYEKFRSNVWKYHEISEKAYINARS